MAVAVAAQEPGEPVLQDRGQRARVEPGGRADGTGTGRPATGRSMTPCWTGWRKR